MYIVVGSITTATRLAKLIERNLGIPASVAHTPTAIGRSGCSYSVRVKEKSLMAVKRLLLETDIRVKAIYVEEIKGREREYHEVS